MQICRMGYVSCVTQSSIVCLWVPMQDRPCLSFYVGLAAFTSRTQGRLCCMWAAGAFEGGSSQGLSLNVFLQWSKQLPALLTSLKSLLTAGSVETDSTAISATNHVIARHSCFPLLVCIHMLCCLSQSICSWHLVLVPVFCSWHACCNDQNRSASVCHICAFCHQPAALH